MSSDASHSTLQSFDREILSLSFSLSLKVKTKFIKLESFSAKIVRQVS